MRYLILGGTRFVGLHIAEAALSRGHRVTLFHRGRTNRDALPGADHVLGDRDGGLDALEDREFDRVIDVSGYVPRLVRDAAEFLRDRTEHYTFISTCSVYEDFTRVGIDEDGGLAKLADPSTEEITTETYGGLKVLCEAAVEDVFGKRSLIVRPGFVVGPHDHTDRFTYWVQRVAEGGDVAAPGAPHRLTQVIDGRDLGDWVVWMADRRRFGPYNAAGPEYMLTWGLMLNRIRYITGSSCEFHWIPDQVLLDEGAAGDMPLFIPAGSDSSGDLHVDAGRAIADGLLFRSLAETIADTYAWSAKRPSSELAAGLDGAREAALLEKAGTGAAAGSRNPL